MAGIRTPVPRLLLLVLTSLPPVFSRYLCHPQVTAIKPFLEIPVGGALSLNCSVIHCGPGSWSGEWGRSDVGNFNPLNLSDDRVQVSAIPVRETQTTLQVTIQNMMYNDSGGYQCRVFGTELNTSNMGRMTNVTVTGTSHGLRVTLTLLNGATYLLATVSARRAYRRVKDQNRTCIKRETTQNTAPPDDIYDDCTAL